MLYKDIIEVFIISVSNSAYPKYVDANVGMAYPSDVGLSAPVTCKNTAIIDGFSNAECAINNWFTTIPDQATTFSHTGDYQEFVAPKKGKLMVLRVLVIIIMVVMQWLHF